jgi:hypothetical protein
MPLTQIVVIRRDLTFGEYSAQLAHAGEAYWWTGHYDTLATQADPNAGAMKMNDTTAIVKGARNEGKIAKLVRDLLSAGVPHVAIREEEGEKGGRLAGQLTCVSLVPTDVEQLPESVKRALNEFHRIEALDGPKLIPG